MVLLLVHVLLPLHQHLQIVVPVVEAEQEVVVLQLLAVLDLVEAVHPVHCYEEIKWSHHLILVL